MTDEIKIDLENLKDKNCTGSCKEFHNYHPNERKYRMPTSLENYLRNIPITHYYGYFDKLLVSKYDKVIYSLKMTIDDGESVEEELELLEEETEEELEEEVEGDDEQCDEQPDKSCIWTDEESSGKTIDCTRETIPNSQYCQEHHEMHEQLMIMLVYYIKDTLKIIDPNLIKSLNSSLKGWKQALVEEVGMSKYLLNKTIKQKCNEGLSPEEIAKYIDNIEI